MIRKESELIAAEQTLSRDEIKAGSRGNLDCRAENILISNRASSSGSRDPAEGPELSTQRRNQVGRVVRVLRGDEGITSRTLLLRRLVVELGHCVLKRRNPGVPERPKIGRVWRLVRGVSPISIGAEAKYGALTVAVAAGRWLAMHGKENEMMPSGE